MLDQIVKPFDRGFMLNTLRDRLQSHFLAAKYSLTLRASQKQKLLLEAVWSGNAKAVQGLLWSGADPNPISSIFEIDGVTREPTRFRVSPLHQAAKLGHTTIARMLLRAGAKIDYQERGRTPLMNAAECGHAETAAMLLRAGADYRIRNILISPLEIAAERGHVDVVGAFIDRGVDVRDRYDYQISFSDSTFAGEDGPLKAAARNGHAEVVRTLLGAGADPESVRGLSLFAAQQHPAVLKLLGVAPACQMAVTLSPVQPKRENLVSKLSEPTQAAGLELN